MGGDGAGSVAAEKVKLSRTPTLQKIKVLYTILKTDGLFTITTMTVTDADDGDDYKDADESAMKTVLLWVV